MDKLKKVNEKNEDKINKEKSLEERRKEIMLNAMKVFPTK